MNPATLTSASLVLGGLLGIGLFLLAAPILWPHADRPADRSAKQKQSKLASGVRDNAELLGLVPSVLIVACAVLAVLGALIAYAVTGVVILALVAGVATASILPVVASARRKAQQKALRLVWSDVVDTLIAAIRSGATIPEAVTSLGASAYPHVSKPALEFAVEYQASGNSDLALTRLKQRWGDAAGDRIVETLRLAREVGSSATTSVLATLSAQLRSDTALRQEIEARQSWIRVAARIGVIAPWIVLALLALRPEAAVAYNSPMGALIVMVGALVSVIAYRVMIAIGVLPRATRWLA